jgi:integration host factor subunit beta
VLVPEKFVPHFKPGKELRERVDGKAGEPMKASNDDDDDL